MLCQKCHKNMATVRYAEVIDGRVSNLMICPSCYAHIEQGDSSGFEIAGEAPKPPRTRRKELELRSDVAHKICRSCGTEFRELVETRMAGCPSCFSDFAEQLEPLLSERHAGLMHRGKTPVVDNERERLRSDLRTKRSLLRSALQAENYEDAAVLRDSIRTLESELATAAGKEG
jgi:protein arginine kinase activator